MVVSALSTGSGVSTIGNIRHNIYYPLQHALQNANFDSNKNSNLRRPNFIDGENIFAELVNYMKHFYDNVKLDKLEQPFYYILIDKLSTCHQINILGAEKVLAQ